MRAAGAAPGARSGGRGRGAGGGRRRVSHCNAAHPLQLQALLRLRCRLQLLHAEQRLHLQLRRRLQRFHQVGGASCRCRSGRDTGRRCRRIAPAISGRLAPPPRSPPGTGGALTRARTLPPPAAACATASGLALAWALRSVPPLSAPRPRSPTISTGVHRCAWPCPGASCAWRALPRCPALPLPLAHTRGHSPLGARSGDTLDYLENVGYLSGCNSSTACSTRSGCSSCPEGTSRYQPCPSSAICADCKVGCGPAPSHDTPMPSAPRAPAHPAPPLRAGDPNCKSCSPAEPELRAWPVPEGRRWLLCLPARVCARGAEQQRQRAVLRLRQVRPPRLLQQLAWLHSQTHRVHGVSSCLTLAPC